MLHTRTCAVILLLALALGFQTPLAAAETAKPAGGAGSAPVVAVTHTPTPGAKPLLEQVKLAVKLYEEMAAADQWSIELFIANHRQVIDGCPDTPWAVESCWRLSNLYLTGRPEPDHQEVIGLMEHALAKYPKNQWSDRFSSRLVNCLQEAGEFQKLFDFCIAQLKEPDLPAETGVSYALRAAQSAQALGQTETAVRFFQETLARDSGQMSTMAQIAQRRLSQLQGGSSAGSPDK